MVLRMREYINTRGLGTPTASQHNLFDSKKLKVFLVLLTGFEPSTFGSLVQRSNHWAHPPPSKQTLVSQTAWVPRPKRVSGTCPRAHHTDRLCDVCLCELADRAVVCDIIMCTHWSGFLMLCVCIEVVYVCSLMCYVQRVEIKLCFGGNCALEKLSIYYY